VAQIPLTLQIEIDKSQLREYLAELERHTPVIFGYTAAHAEFMDMGTGPQSISPRSSGRHPIGEEGRKAIEKWVRRKLGIHDEKEVKKVTQAVIWSISHKGLKPTGFFRSALYQVVDRMQYLYDQGYTFVDMANEIGDISKANIRQGMLGGKPMADTNALERSWLLEELSREDADARANRTDVRSILDEGDTFKW